MTAKIPNTQEHPKTTKSSEGYIITDVVISKIYRQTDPINLLTLLNVLYKDAREKNNKTIYASNSYLMEKVDWGKKKLIKYKKELEKIKIIKVIKKQLKKDGFKQKQYITLLYMRESDNKINKHNSSPTPPPPEKPPQKKQNKITEEIKRRYLPIATQLAKIIMDNKNITITPTQMNEWGKQIRLLSRTSKINTNRILTALNWYSTHINDKYTPVIQSGKSLREKFLQLESAMTRVAYSNNKKNSQSQHEKLTDEYNNLTKAIKYEFHRKNEVRH